MPPLRLGEMTTEECARLLAMPAPVVLLPVGSTEPHGPHLPLATDAILSEHACVRAAEALREVDVAAVVAPTLAYGVTRYARDFAGAVSLSPETTERVVGELLGAYRAMGFAVACVVNNHLEPEHVESLSRATRGVPGAVFANQLTRRWGRTLSDEFKRGDCHAGEYETSLVMAARGDLVREDVRATLAPVPISLSDAIRAGQKTFREMGSERGYFGTPQAATRDEGDGLYARLVTMIVTEVREALGREDA